MIKFFRKIRQNLLSEGKNVKYLKYAFGEIVLVVFGILIAIWINKWNESKDQHSSSKEYLVLVNDEIKINLEYMSAVLASSEKEIIDTEFFIQYLNLKDTLEISDSIVNTIVDRIEGSTTVKISSSAIEDFKNSGSIGAIKSKSVRKRLLLIEAWYQTFERYNVEIGEEWDNYLFPYFLKNSTFSNSKMTSNLTKEIEIDFDINRSAFVHNKELNNLLLNHLKATNSSVILNKYWIEALEELSKDLDDYLNSN